MAPEASETEFGRSRIEPATVERPRTPQPAVRSRSHLHAGFVRHLAISVGGALGASARWLVGTWAAARWGEGYPLGTLLINVSGSFILGFYLALVAERFTGRATTRLLVATGFLGAFTTFSAFSLDTLHLLQTGQLELAGLYILETVVGGLAGAGLGIAAAHAL